MTFTDLGPDRRAVTPAVTHVLTIAITSLLVIGLLATAGSFLNTEEQTNAREDLDLIGNRLADEVSRVDTLARNGGTASIVTRHPSEVTGGGYTVEHMDGSPCVGTNDSCLELQSQDLAVSVNVPLQHTTTVQVKTVSPGTFNITGFDATPGDDFEENALSTGLSLRTGVAGDVREDPLGTRLTTRNEPPIPQFGVDPDPPTTAERSFLNGSASYDPDGNISEYKWDVGDDGLYTERGEVAPYWFAEPGRHEIELRTADDADETAATSATENVTVSGLEYQNDLSEGDHDQSVRYSFYNNWSEPIRLDSIFVDGPDRIDELGDCDDEEGDTEDFESEINIDTNGDNDRDFYYEIDDGDWDSSDDEWDCEPGHDIPDDGLVFDVDQQLDPDDDIDTNVDNDWGGDVPIVPPDEEVTIELAGLDDDLDGSWRLGVSYLNGSLGSETVFEDSVGAPHVTDFSVDASGDSVEVTVESDDPLDPDSIVVDHGDNESSHTSSGSFTETESGGPWEYTAEVQSDVSGWYWAELTDAEDDITGVQAYDLPPRDSAVAVDDGDDAGWHTASDWDDNTFESNVVHEDFADRASDRIGLGYARADGGGDNLTAYWPMDDDDSSTMDDHRNAPDSRDGSTTDIFDETVGLFGTTSYAFTSDSSRVDVDAPAGTSAQNQFSGGDDATITVSTWIHPRDDFANSDGSVVIGKLEDTAGDGGDWSLVVEDGCPGYADGGCDGTPNVGYYAGNGTDEYALLHGPVTQEDTWHHVAFVLDEADDELSLYYDGRLEESVDGLPESVTANTSQDIVVGEHPATGENFDGYVDETRIYNRSLSGTEILGLYRTSRTGGFTTDWKNGTNSFDADQVNLSAAVDLNGGDVTVTVVSNESERSDPIDIRDGNHDYDVTGLTTAADGWRLEVDVESRSPIMTPDIDKLVVHDHP